MFVEIRPKNWRAARNIGEQLADLRDWAFRGQSVASWRLTSTLERILPRFHNNRLSLSIGEEVRVLKEFQKRAHHHLRSPPEMSETLEWLSMLQHHGAPTRLLDFSYSYYVACFFAFQDVTREAAVWGASILNLECRAEEVCGDVMSKCSGNSSQLIDCFLNEEQSDLVVFDVEPRRLTERQSAQQGLFLFPGDISRRFEENFYGKKFDQRKQIQPSRVIEHKRDRSLVDEGLMEDLIKIVLPVEMRTEAFRDFRAMNINASTLFPGLDGLPSNPRATPAN